MPAIYDVSIIINDKLDVYPGDPKVKIEKLKNIKKDGYELSKIEMGVHTGTHIDAPAHFFDGRSTICELPLDVLIGKAIVLEFSNEEYIGLSDIESVDFTGYTRVLFKTRNSGTTDLSIFSEDYVYLSPETADYLVEKGVKLIGFDYYSLDKYNSDMPVHKKLLQNDIVIIEGLDLSKIESGEYELLALPIKLETEGAPARVLLRKLDECIC